MFKQVNFEKETFQVVYKPEEDYILVASFEDKGYGFLDIFLTFSEDGIIYVRPKVYQEGRVLDIMMNSILYRKRFLKFIIGLFRKSFPVEYQQEFKLVG